MQFSLADRDAVWASKLSWVPLCAHVPNAPLLQANSRGVSRETSVRFPFLSAGWCLRAGGSRSTGGVHRHGSRPARQARGSASVARRLAIGGTCVALPRHAIGTASVARPQLATGGTCVARLRQAIGAACAAAARDGRGACKTRSEAPRFSAPQGRERGSPIQRHLYGRIGCFT